MDNSLHTKPTQTDTLCAKCGQPLTQLDNDCLTTHCHVVRTTGGYAANLRNYSIGFPKISSLAAFLGIDEKSIDLKPRKIATLYFHRESCQPDLRKYPQKLCAMDESSFIQLASVNQ